MSSDKSSLSRRSFMKWSAAAAGAMAAAGLVGCQPAEKEEKKEQGHPAQTYEMDGTWKNDDNTSKAINYWWGMSAGVVDVICSQNLPTGTQKLVELLKHTICAGEFNPFSGILYSQDGIIKDHPDNVLSPEEIMAMDWLSDNIIGSIPKLEELTEHAQPALSQQGVQAAKGSGNE